ncbi:MAG: phytanoyl-CoA dioxygenase family protein, partial [Pseudomonadota bacterium]
QWRADLEQAETDWLDAGLPRPLMTYKRVNAQLVMPLAHDIGTHPAILDVVTGVLGPDILLYSVEFMTKEAHSKHVVTMHQDLAYWGYGESDGILTAWLALSPATKNSGCMDFVKGSHKNEIIPHKDTFSDTNLLSRGQEIQVDVAEDDKVCAALAPGQISLHHGLMIHGSGPNVTQDRRIGAVIRYLSPHVVKPGGHLDYGYPALGHCDTGNYALTSAPKGWFHADDLATYETVRADQAKVMMAGATGNAEMYS